MSRVNKYRAWNIKKKIMCYDNEDRDNDCWYGTFPSMVMLINQYLNLPEHLKEYEYMQYIGVDDKNGREIYEGDIVRNFLCIDDYRDKLYEYGVVAYDEETLGFFVFDNGNNKLNIAYMENIEVIGNMYENADLLKEAENE